MKRKMKQTLHVSAPAPKIDMTFRVGHVNKYLAWCEQTFYSPVTQKATHKQLKYHIQWKKMKEDFVFKPKPQYAFRFAFATLVFIMAKNFHTPILGFLGAVATDTSGTSNTGLNVSISLTLAATATMLIAVGGGGTGNAADTALWNSVSMTQAIHRHSGFGDAATALYIGSPATGTHNLDYTYNGQNGSSASCGGISFTGSDNAIGASNSGASRDLSVTTTRDNSYLVDFLEEVNTGNNTQFTVGSGQTQLLAAQNGTTFFRVAGYVAAGAAGSTATNWTTGTDGGAASNHVAVEVMAPAIINDSITVTENIPTFYPFFPVTLGVNPDLPHKGPKVWGT